MEKFQSVSANQPVKRSNGGKQMDGLEKKNKFQLSDPAGQYNPEFFQVYLLDCDLFQAILDYGIKKSGKLILPTSTFGGLSTI